jgi:predicted dienelactone hydrolase
MGIWVGVKMLLLLACVGTEKVVEEIFTPPDQRGQYTVSSDELAFINSNGMETPLQIWYPTSEEDDELYRYDELISGTSIDTARPDCDKTREVVMFSHGNQGIRYQSYFLMEHLASHGYLVAAPRHVENSFFDFQAEAMTSMVFRRPIDIQNAYDHLLTVEKLSGCLDEIKGYATVGHSFGGYTTVANSGAVIDTEVSDEFCQDNLSGWLCDEVAEYALENGSGVYDLSDDRAWAGIPMAPAGFEALYGGLSQVEIPMMVLGGDLDSSTTMSDQVEPIFRGMVNSSATMGTLIGANHYSFSNICEILPTMNYCQDTGGNEDVHQVINTLTVAFLGLQRGEQRMLPYFPPATEQLLWTD